MKILFYAINGIGLGHLNKMILVAKEVRKLRPDSQILFLTNSKFTELLDVEKFGYILLPFSESNLLFKPYEKNYISYLEYDELLVNIVNSFRPNVIVYDWRFPTVLVHHARLQGIRNVFIMRKDANKFLASMLNEPMLDKFDYLCLPYSKKEFEDLKVGKNILGLIKDKRIEFVGPIVKNCNKRKRKDKKFRIVVSAGGGGWHDTEPFFQYALKACKNLVSATADVECRIITGPLYNGNLDHNAYSDRILIEKFNSDFIQILADSDLAVTRAGYNMCNEIVAAKTPAIIMPGNRFVEATIENAKLLERKGVAIVINEYWQLQPLLHKLYTNKKLINNMKRSFSALRIKPGNTKISEQIVKLAEDTLYISLNFGQVHTRGILTKSAQRKYKNVVFEGNNIANYLPAMIKQAVNKNVIQIRSNDKKLSDVKFVSQLIDSGVNSFMIDLYNYGRAASGSFKKIKKEFRRISNMIKTLNMYQVHLVVNCSINKSNYEYIPQIVRLLIKSGVFQIQLTISGDNKPEVSKQILALRRLQLNPHTSARWVYFCNDKRSPDALNMGKFYNVMIEYYGRKIKKINRKIDLLCAEKGIVKRLANCDALLNELKDELTQQYSGRTIIEEKLNAILERKNNLQNNTFVKSGKNGELLRLVKIEKALRAALNRHYAQKTKPVKDALFKLLYEREALLKKSGIYKSVYCLQKEKEKHEREFEFFYNALNNLAAK